MIWRRSSYSGDNGDCVEVAWRRSSHSGNQGDCVEVAWPDEVAAVRDSKAPEAGQLAVSRAAWSALLTALR